jgi:hypothetical protein
MEATFPCSNSTTPPPSTSFHAIPQIMLKQCSNQNLIISIFHKFEKASWLEDAARSMVRRVRHRCASGLNPHCYSLSFRIQECLPGKSTIVHIYLIISGINEMP